MYTSNEVETLKKRLEAEGKSKAEIVKALAWACFGWPYVFGAWGEYCTPKERTRRANLRPKYKSRIYNACPVLSGKPETCDGCKWDGTRCFDCRGFTDWLLKQVGIDLYGDTCGNQYNTKSNWAAQGKYKDMPKELVCCVFEYTGGKYPHTGMHVGGGVAVHCSATVQDGKRNWAYYAIPAGLYTDEELRKAGLDVEENRNIQTIRKGATGNLVKYLQGLLINEGYDAYLSGEKPIDGIFGTKTEKAVKAFQRASGLTDDGIVGPKTWAALGVVPDDDEDEQPEEPDEPEDTVRVPKAMLSAWADTLEDMAADIRGYAG